MITWTPGTLLDRETEQLRQRELQEVEQIRESKSRLALRPRERRGPQTLPRNAEYLCSGRVWGKFSRLLSALEFIASKRLGATIPMLHEHLEHEYCISPRTTLRDAVVLVELGFVLDDRSEGISRLKINPRKLVSKSLTPEHLEQGTPGMASIARTPKGTTRILFYDKDGYRKAIYLGKCSKEDAEKVKYRVESILSAGILGNAISPDDANWLKKFPRVREKFELVGLVEPVEPVKEKESPTLAEFLDDYMKRKSPMAKPGTVAVWRQVVDALKKHMPQGIRMDQLTAGHATAFVDKLKQSGIANSTIANRVTKSKQFFADAVEWEIIADNPFGKTKKPACSKKSNVFVKRQDIAKVMAVANIRWKTIIALSRFGGLRTPSETLSIKWTDIDLESGMMQIPEPKVEHHEGRGVRECPIFQELYDVLVEARAAAPLDAEYVVDAQEYRAAANTGDGWKNANLRTQFLKLLKKADVAPWSRLFHSMRASRQTELHEEYPLQAVCAWIGNSEEVAKSNYLLMREEYISKAIGRAPNATRAGDNLGQKERGEADTPSGAEGSIDQENTGENYVCAGVSEEPKTDGEGFEPPVE